MNSQLLISFQLDQRTMSRRASRRHAELAAAEDMRRWTTRRPHDTDEVPVVTA